MKHSTLSLAAIALGLSLNLSLAGCSGIPTNSSMNSVHQPVVEQVNYTLDLATGNGGLSQPERERLGGWFEALGLRYGDAIAVEDPMQNPDTLATVDAMASRYGLQVSQAVPVAAGYVEAGTTRVVVTRSKAVVHGCPDWTAHSDANPANALSRNYGCATNSNLAAMVADPQHLLRGDGSTGDTSIMTSNKAITAYRAKAVTGTAELKAVDSKGQ